MINYRYIVEAQEFYRDIGYTYVEVPWVVSREAYYATKPKGAWDVTVEVVEDCPYEYTDERTSMERDNDTKLVASPELNGFLPASGEQSFLDYLWQDGEDPMFSGVRLGKFMTVTPCFRSEEYDDLHKPWFIKAELIWTGVQDKNSLLLMISDAFNFFNMFRRVKVVETLEGYDIVDYVTGIELGSYGMREYKENSYMYGTGVAEPRLSQVINKGIYSV